MTLLYHWRELGLLGAVVAVIVALQVFLPGVLPAVLRWLLGTEWGRCLLLATAIGLGWWSFRDHYVAAGRAAVLAEQEATTARATVRAALATLDAYMAGAQAQKAIGDQLDAAHEANDRARDRLVSDLRRGIVQLRDHWRCDVPHAAGPTAAGPARDEGTERREEGAGDLVQAADDADDDLRACQAQVRNYQRIGVLRVP